MDRMEDFRYNLGLGIPESMLGVYLHEVEPKNENQAKLKNLLTELKNKKFDTLLLIGDTGTGKTYMAQALANTMIYNATYPEYAALYTTHFEMDLNLKATMNAGYSGPSEKDCIVKYKTYGLLIIDELGRAQTSDYTMNRLEHIICERMARGKRTIIISNKSPEELRGILDIQMQDRLGICEGDVKTNPMVRRCLMSGQSLRGRL